VYIVAYGTGVSKQQGSILYI